MKKIVCLLVAIVICSSALAQDNNIQDRKFSFSIGYRAGFATAPSISSYWEDKKIMFVESFHHFVSLDFNYAISPKWEIGLATGMNNTRLPAWSIPLYANAQFFFNDRTRGWFNYADVGTNMNLHGGFNVGALAGFGGGYRLYIANKFKMDFSLGYVYNYTTNNSASQNAIQLGVALVF